MTGPSCKLRHIRQGFMAPKKTGKRTIAVRAQKKIVSKPIIRGLSYDTDFYQWSKHQASLLKKGDLEHLDVRNLAEEIESLGKSDKRSLRSHLKILLLHLLKTRYQTKKQTKSWKLSIENARDEIQFILNDSPSLKNSMVRLIQEAYRLARREAFIETGLSIDHFPEKCPWTKSDIL